MRNILPKNEATTFFKLCFQSDKVNCVSRLLPGQMQKILLLLKLRKAELKDKQTS